MVPKPDLCAAVHELAASEIPKAYLFRGTRETTAQQVAKMLGLGLVQFKRQAGMPGPSGSPGLGRFLLPYSECDYTLESIIDDLQVLREVTFMCSLHLLVRFFACTPVMQPNWLSQVPHVLLWLHSKCHSWVSTTVERDMHESTHNHAAKPSSHRFQLDLYYTDIHNVPAHKGPAFAHCAAS